MTDPQTLLGLAEKLSDGERDLLLAWPDSDALFFRQGNKPGHAANGLIDVGACRLRPWKHGTQLAIMPLGIKLADFLRARASNPRGEGV
jgi:hypothetical protein